MYDVTAKCVGTPGPTPVLYDSVEHAAAVSAENIEALASIYQKLTGETHPSYDRLYNTPRNQTPGMPTQAWYITPPGWLSSTSQPWRLLGLSSLTSLAKIF